MYYIRIILYFIVLIGFISARAGPNEDFFKLAELDQSRAVAAQLKQGFDPNSTNDKGQTGLLFALQNDSFAVAELLISYPRTDVNLANPLGETPLMLAAIKGQVELCRQLIARGAQINKPGWSPLHYAASAAQADLAVLQLLLTRGAKVNAESANKTTPLMMAAGYGSEDAVALLLKQGGDPRQRNDLGLNAADFAQNGGREGLAERLAKAAK